jgi:Kef-type K+ transport system membrane component KefB
LEPAGPPAVWRTASGQPPVIGELAAGIALGPSAFGLVAPGLFAGVFTADVATVVLVSGCVLAAGTLSSLAGPASTPLTFTLFLGIAFAITAMPVLARILVDLRMLRTTTGTIAMWDAPPSMTSRRGRYWVSS